MTKNVKCYVKILKKFDFLHFSQNDGYVFVGYCCKASVKPLFKIFGFLLAELRTIHSVMICIEVRHSESIPNTFEFKTNTFAPQLKTVDKLFLYCYNK